MNPFGMPGIGGSLGTCAICGDPFLTEILLGKEVKSFSLGGHSQTLFGHDKCLAPYEDGKQFDVSTLPEKSPLRLAYERQQKEKVAA